MITSYLSAFFPFFSLTLAGFGPPVNKLELIKTLYGQPCATCKGASTPGAVTTTGKNYVVASLY